MKNITLVIIIILSALSCKAQSPIIALTDKSQPNVNNAYYKDVDNDMNKFVGTWKFENNSSTLIIKLQKKEAHYNGLYYKDKFIGEYKFIENGVEVLNYLPRLNDPSVNDAQHSIDGGKLVRKNYFPECTNCLQSERIFALYFSDFERSYLRSEIILRYVNTNGVEKLQVRLGDYDNAMLPYENAPSQTRVPYGVYELIKQ